jgi:hypothetical protein
MPDRPDDHAAYVDAAAAALGLAIGPWRDGVVQQFALAASMNALVDAFPLALGDESGSVFVPVTTPAA